MLNLSPAWKDEPSPVKVSTVTTVIQITPVTWLLDNSVDVKRRWKTVDEYKKPLDITLSVRLRENQEHGRHR